VEPYKWINSEGERKMDDKFKVKRANAVVVWFPGTLMSQDTCPDLLAKPIRVNTKKNLR
jgi:hypothetical protein